MKKTLFILLGFSILALLFLTQCSVFTPLPETTTIDERLAVFPTDDLPFDEEINVYWDKYQTPFIEAESDSACAFALGMTHTHLRWAEMALFKRIVQGRISEIAGPFTSDIDLTIRMLDLDRAVDSIINQMPEDTRLWMQWFVEGMNFYVSRQDELPHEFHVLGLEPEVWTLRDLITMNRLYSLDVNVGNWFSYISLMKEPEWDRFWDRINEQDMRSDSSYPAGNMVSLQHSPIMNVSRSGSNSFAVTPEYSELGAGFIANDPHVGITVPNLWMLVGYKCPSFHVVGMTLPGLPFIALGRSNYAAWGGTNMRSASSSLIDINDYPDSLLVEETIVIKNRLWSDSEEIIRSSPYGPVISDSPVLEFDEGTKAAFKWVGHYVSDEYTAFYKSNQATNWEEFRDAFATYAVSGQTFIFVDNDGGIGQVAGARLPKRDKGNRERLFQSMERTDREWSDFYTPVDLPTIYYPNNAYLVSANNIPVRTDPPIGYSFSSNDRVQRISKLIEGNTPLDMEDIRKIQMDAYSISSNNMKKFLVKKIESLNIKDSLEIIDKEALNELVGWNGSYAASSKGALIYQLMAFYIVSDFYLEEYSEAFVSFFLRSDKIHTLILNDLKEVESQRLGKIIKSAFKKSTEDYNDFDNWGDFHRLRIQHILGNIPVLGSKYHYAEFPARGFASTVLKTSASLTNEQHQTTYGAASRHVSIMSDVDENYFLLLGGNDGWVMSENSLDHIEMWMKGEYIQLPLRLETWKKNAYKKLTLK
jgi:penicillin amidase